MILSGETIRKYGLLSPMMPRTNYEGFTYGLGPAGYDVRVEFDSVGEREHQLLCEHSFMLASTIERFNMPLDVVGIVHDKSSWARRGLAVQNTVIEPGWSGYLTLELTNHGSQPLMISRGVGIAQVIFYFLDQHVEGYVGKYQDQKRGPRPALA